MARNQWCLFFMLLIGAVAHGQRELPQEYVPAEELISLNSNLDFSQALDLLSEYAIRLEGKPLYDPTRQTGTIGIDITTLPWEKALQAILSRRGLWYAEREHFIQIMVPEDHKNGSDNGVSEGIQFSLGNREIKIETIFFEGNRKDLAEMGVDWTTLYKGKVTVNGEMLGASSLMESFLSAGIIIPKSLVEMDVRALFSTLSSRNVGKILARPQVMVSEGNEGKIQVGEDFSIKTRDFAGNIIDRFFSTGTILQVTPFLIMDPDKGPVIFLKAHVERSQAYPDVVSTIIKKSEANSYVQLYDGEETVIAGLYSTEQTTLRKGIPVLMNLPKWFFGLRYLFSYDHKEEQEKELIIIIKASLLPEVFVRKDRPQGTRGHDTQEKVYRYLREHFHDPVPEASPAAMERTVHRTGLPHDEINAEGVTAAEPITASQRQQDMGPASRQTESAADHSAAAARGAVVEKMSPSSPEQGITVNKLVQPALAVNRRQAENETSASQPVYRSALYPDFKAELKAGVETAGAALKDVYRGVVKQGQAHTVLIPWQNGFDPTVIESSQLTVFRRPAGEKAYQPVGKVRILRSHDTRSVGLKLKEAGTGSAIVPGDQVVVKL